MSFSSTAKALYLITLWNGQKVADGFDAPRYLMLKFELTLAF